MSAPFPAVIKEIRLGVTETVLTLDVSVPDVQTLAGLLDREVSVLITEPQGALPAIAPPKSAAPIAPSTPTPALAPEKLPFEPDDPPSALPTNRLAIRPRPPRRSSRSRK